MTCLAFSGIDTSSFHDAVLESTSSYKITKKKKITINKNNEKDKERKKGKKGGEKMYSSGGVHDKEGIVLALLLRCNNDIILQIS